MPWVKAEYAGELAVVAAWITALVPWSVSLLPDGPLGSILFIVRWPLLELQVRIPAAVNGESLPVEQLLAEVYPGTKLFGSFYMTEPITTATYYEVQPLFYGGVAWVGGAGLVIGALALSLALYRDETGTAERLPVDHVRVMAVLLGLVTIAFAIATIYYWIGREIVGIPLPVGVLIVGALAVILGRVDRV
jgi:hypothetical protein